MVQNTQEVTGAQPIRLSVSYKVIWGIAALGSSLISGIYGALLPIFYQDYLGLQARWIGIASVIYAVWNAINDPLFGYITDSTRSRLGRRIPYMRYTAPFLAMILGTIILIWFPLRGEHLISVQEQVLALHARKRAQLERQQG